MHILILLFFIFTTHIAANYYYIIDHSSFDIQLHINII